MQAMQIPHMVDELPHLEGLVPKEVLPVSASLLPAILATGLVANKMQEQRMSRF